MKIKSKTHKLYKNTSKNEIFITKYFFCITFFTIEEN